jgi:hypothetical protein
MFLMRQVSLISTVFVLFKLHLAPPIFNHQTSLKSFDFKIFFSFKAFAWSTIKLFKIKVKN